MATNELMDYKLVTNGGSSITDIHHASSHCTLHSSEPSPEDVFLEQLHQRSRRQIKLNVGGRHFVTSVTTLTADPDSMLAAMFSGRHKLDVDEDMSVFVDRNGDTFAPILEWLRTGCVPPPVLENDSVRRSVLVEAKYFQLEGLSKKLEEADAQPMEDAAMDSSILQSSIIKLNVGGQFYSTSLTTLKSDPSSMLSAMFSGRHHVLRDEQDRVFIDRDGALFAHILNWLRSRTLPPLDRVVRAGLLAEAQYFQLDEFSTALLKGDVGSHTQMRQISPEVFYSCYQSSLVHNQPLVFSYVDLRLIPSMAGLYLLKADFRGSNLSGVCLHNTTLEEARLQGALFHHCDIQSANLRGAHLHDAELDNANLQSALMDRCLLAGASLICADLRQAYMRSARHGSTTNFQGALVEGTHGLDLDQVNTSRTSNGSTSAGTRDTATTVGQVADAAEI